MPELPSLPTTGRGGGASCQLWHPCPLPYLGLLPRTKRTMGLGSLYGENDLLELDGDPQRERQVAEKQLAQLGDIL